MKIDPKLVISQSLKYYVDKERSGAELSQSIKHNFDKIYGLNTNQVRAFSYYVDFFEKEGDHLYLPSNVYLKEEVDELKELLDSLESN